MIIDASPIVPIELKIIIGEPPMISNVLTIVSYQATWAMVVVTIPIVFAKWNINVKDQVSCKFQYVKEQIFAFYHPDYKIKIPGL